MGRSFRIPFAKKSLSQNFLTEEEYISAIIEAIDPQPSELIVEIGPGRGALTEKLLREGTCVAAIEFDRDLAAALRLQFSEYARFNLIEADALQANFAEIVTSLGGSIPVKLAANLPYNISSPILRRLIDQRMVFSMMILMFQREVADRLTAAPGCKERGFITVMAEVYFNVERLFGVPPNAFYPKPKVWSSVTRFLPREEQPNVSENFPRLLKTAFSHKRKTILNNLKEGFQSAEKALINAGINPKRRAETLTIDEWINLDMEFLTLCPSLAGRGMLS